MTYDIQEIMIYLTYDIQEIIFTWHPGNHYLLDI
jgi:hypothetical protein